MSVDPLDPQPSHVSRAVKALKRGGVVVFPTQGLYGLGADAKNEMAVDRVFAIKQRSSDNPLLVLVPDRSAVDELAVEVTPIAMRLMDRFWPGRVTLVFNAQSHLPSNLTAGRKKIGIRVSGHPVAAALVSRFGRPVTGTSANLSGRPGCDRAEELDPQVAAQVDLILDAGRLSGGQGSTVVDVTGSKPIIIREGVVSKMEIQVALHS